jgi:hypothetical protein
MKAIKIAQSILENDSRIQTGIALAIENCCPNSVQTKVHAHP